ncbi:site-specific integrase [Mucilaginibacter corticis]|uniref:Site-specific integrase n=1 Tax=Mucilaginibacter corticis TaxID=2597670 RepID=A0A556MRX8_9SPHI|nr:site-specific integrase [Mucilaginibacter corticis]TSJ42635.1 site-specific integrase [Mucilaginibacter corticis]
MAIKDIKPVKINFNLRDQLNKDKDTAIHCVVRFNNQKIVISSVEAVKPKYWDGDRQRAKASRQFPEYPEFNQRLDEIEATVKTVYRTYISEYKQYPTTDELKLRIKMALSDQGWEAKPVKITLLKFVEQLIADTKGGKRINPKTKQRFAPDSHKAYQNTLRALERFEKHVKIKLDFDAINLEFYNDFKDYLLNEEKVSNNYFGLHIKNIKLFLNESFEIGLHNNQKHNHKHFTKLQNETDNIYLNREQLEVLTNLDLSKNARLDRVRDLFLVGCWTGLRFSDFNAIGPKNIQGDFIEIETQKTGETVVIPIHQTIKTILGKYEGLTPNSLPPSISNVNMNKYLKELAKEAKFNDLQQIRFYKGGKVIVENIETNELISTHTARRSFATNMHLMGVPSINIMGITGHCTEKAFLKYIKVTPKEHAVKLREIWSRMALKVVEV